MIVASLLLVIVAAVTLVIGLFNPENATWVWASIACCVVAGLLLIAGVVRSRPRRKPVLQAGTDQPASWAGAQSWATVDPATGAVVERDSATAPADAGESVRVVEEAPPAAASAAPEPAEASGAAAQDPTQWAEPSVGEVVPPVPTPASPDPGATGAQTATTGEIPSPMPAEPAPPAAKRTTRKATASAASSGGTSDAEKINAALTGISGVGPAKRQALIAEFSTYRKLRAASVERLEAVPGVSRALAERIHTALHS